MTITRLSGANAITGTLPATNINDTSIGNITALPAGVGGKVLQVVQGTSTTSTSTTSTSYVTANLSASITPSSASNKILIMLHGCGDTDAGGRQWFLAMFRGATNISGGVSLAFDSSYNSAGRQINTTALTHLDSPSTTSSTTYTLHIKSANGDNVEFCTQDTQARIVLMEIAG